MFRKFFAILIVFAPFIAAATSQRFDVPDFGATGNGVADDQPAIKKAVEAVTRNKGGVLFFPRGVYRCARQQGMQNGIEFDGVSNVTILFDAGAVLLMDNLNPQSGVGDFGHGLVFRGPCHNIALTNVAVKWAKKPSSRSMGDAFRFEGFPDEAKCISNIHFVNCSAELSPQVGAVFMGCSDIAVENFRITRTYADGLHFNACRRAHVSGVTGIETGDDTLSFVTYEDDDAVKGYNGYPGAYARADFGEWNSNGSTANDIYAKGGAANGVRLAGAVNVSVSNVTVEGKLCAVISDCGKKDNKHSWSWLASRGITISNMIATGCASGFHVANFNQPMSGDDKWWRFGITASKLSVRDCKNDSLFIKNVASVVVRDVKAENRRILIVHARDCALQNVRLKNGELEIEGQADASTVETMPNMNVGIRNVVIDHGYFEIWNCRGLTCRGVRVRHPIGEGVRESHIGSSRLEGIVVE